MTWFRVDDTFGTHPKVTAIPRGAARLRAVGLWTMVGDWCAQHLTDGHFGRHVADENGASRADIAHLLRVGLWEEVPEGIVFHDWTDWNPSRAEVLADRSAAKERMRKGRAKKRAAQDAATDDDSSEVVRANSDRTSGAVRTPRPVPSRPNAAAAADGGHDEAPGAPADDPAIEILASKLRQFTTLRGLRTDKLDPDQARKLNAVIAKHGDVRLVDQITANRRHLTDPPQTIQAFLPGWEAMPDPGQRLQVVGAPECAEPGHTGTVRHCAQCASERLAGGDR